MPTVRTALLGALIAAAALVSGTAQASADPTSAAALRPAAGPLRVVLLPVYLHGEPRATPAGLRRMLHDAGALMDRASFGRIHVTGVVAPPIRAGRFETSPRFLEPAIFRYGIARAVARGVRFDGALPVFVAASRTPTASYGSTGHVLVQGSTWRMPGTVVHELGHALGLDHAVAPTECQTPFRPLACAARPRLLFEYGDDFDLMGYGEDRFGAYSLAVLGLATLTDAPPGRARTTIRPSDRPAPTLLRLRAAGGDWLVESRYRATLRRSRTVRAPAGVEITRVASTYSPAVGGDLTPHPMRLPATDPGVVCTGDRRCLARQVFAPGRSLTVPGGFRLRVLPGSGSGRARVETTWLDRTPPVAAVDSATIVRPVGGAPELVLGLGASAQGAGVLGVEVDQGAGPVRTAADDVPGLADLGRGTLRTPLLTGATSARVTLVDAAGNRSAPAVADLTAAPVEPAATIGFSPVLGLNRSVAPSLPTGTAVTVSGTTDAAFAGFEGRVSLASSSVSENMPVTIGPGGAFTITWTAPGPGLYRVEVTVPVERQPDGINLRGQTREGWFRI